MYECFHCGGQRLYGELTLTQTNTDTMTKTALFMSAIAHNAAHK